MAKKRLFLAGEHVHGFGFREGFYSLDDAGTVEFVSGEGVNGCYDNVPKAAASPEGSFTEYGRSGSYWYAHEATKEQTTKILEEYGVGSVEDLSPPVCFQETGSDYQGEIEHVVATQAYQVILDYVSRTDGPVCITMKDKYTQKGWTHKSVNLSEITPEFRIPKGKRALEVTSSEGWLSMGYSL